MTQQYGGQHTRMGDSIMTNLTQANKTPGVVRRIGVVSVCTGFCMAFLVMGCATSESKKSNDLVWYQNGKTADDTRRDLAACKFEAEKNENPLATTDVSYAIADRIRRNEMVHDCMVAKGYEQVKQSSIGEFQSQESQATNNGIDDRKIELQLVGHWESTTVPLTAQKNGVVKMMLDFHDDNQLVATSITNLGDLHSPQIVGTFAVHGNSLSIYAAGTPPSSASFSLFGDRLSLWINSEEADFAKMNTNAR
jgi:hypothetical protein